MSALCQFRKSAVPNSQVLLRWSETPFICLAARSKDANPGDLLSDLIRLVATSNDKKL
jgi:hypothetical protein